MRVQAVLDAKIRDIAHSEAHAVTNTMFCQESQKAAKIIAQGPPSCPYCSLALSRIPSFFQAALLQPTQTSGRFFCKGKSR